MSEPLQSSTEQKAETSLGVETRGRRKRKRDETNPEVQKSSNPPPIGATSEAPPPNAAESGPDLPSCSFDPEKNSSGEKAKKEEGPKKKHRRRRGRGRKKWKPFNKLSHDERRRLAVREEKQAEKSLKQRMRHGVPVAPYNTTQFLLEDRQNRSVHAPENIDEVVDESLHSKERQNRWRRRSRSESLDASESISGSGGGSGSDSSEPDDDYLEREFTEEYENLAAERLNSMSKEELIRDYLEMEKNLEVAQTDLTNAKNKMEELREENSKLRIMSNVGQTNGSSPEARLQALAEENFRLKRQLERLTKIPRNSNAESEK